MEMCELELNPAVPVAVGTGYQGGHSRDSGVSEQDSWAFRSQSPSRSHGPDKLSTIPIAAEEPGFLGRIRRAFSSLQGKDFLSAFTALVNMVVIVLLVGLVNPYKTDLVVVQQQLSDVRTAMAVMQANSDAIQGLSNISRLTGMTELVQSQVSELGSRSGVVFDLLDASSQGMAQLNSTMGRLSQLLDLPDVTFNGTLGNCTINYPFPSTTTGTLTIIIPILQSNLTVLNPLVRVDFFCRWLYDLGGPTTVAMSMVAQGQSNMLDLQVRSDPEKPTDMYTSGSGNATKTGVFSLTDILLAITYPAVNGSWLGLQCPTICATIQY